MVRTYACKLAIDLVYSRSIEKVKDKAFAGRAALSDKNPSAIGISTYHDLMGVIVKLSQAMWTFHGQTLKLSRPRLL